MKLSRQYWNWQYEMFILTRWNIETKKSKFEQFLLQRESGASLRAQRASARLHGVWFARPRHQVNTVHTQKHHMEIDKRQHDPTNIIKDYTTYMFSFFFFISPTYTCTNEVAKPLVILAILWRSLTKAILHIFVSQCVNARISA